MSLATDPDRASSRGRHVVIVGAGFAGINVARTLSRRGKGRVEVTLIDRHNYNQFTPLLYQVATAALAPQEIAVPVRSLYRPARVSTLMGNVTDVDLARRRIGLGQRELSYDYLVIATGAEPHYFGNSDWAAHLQTLSSVDSAVRLREHILINFEAAEHEPDPERQRELLTSVVVGAGPTGVELAGALSELGKRVLAGEYHNFTCEDIRVVVLEAAERVLPTFAPELSRRAERDLRQLGVEVHTGAKVSAVSKNTVVTSSGTFTGATLCWGAGVAPGALIDALPLELDGGRVVVGPDCSVPGDDRVFVIGDAAHFVEPGAASPLPGLAPVAIQQGKHVARCILADLAAEARERFEYRDKGLMATIGRSRAVVQAGRLRMGGFLAWLAWLALHVWYLLGPRMRLLVLFEWTWAYVRNKRGARLILRQPEPEAPLRVRRALRDDGPQRRRAAATSAAATSATR